MSEHAVYCDAAADRIDVLERDNLRLESAEIDMESKGQLIDWSNWAKDTQPERAHLLWQVLRCPMGEAGLRLLTDATASMTPAEFHRAMRHAQW